MKEQLSFNVFQITLFGSRRWWLAWGGLALFAGCAHTTSNLPAQRLPPPTAQETIPTAAPSPVAPAALAAGIGIEPRPASQGVTPAPVTPAPVTPAPVTPAPVTPAPVTPPSVADGGDGQDLPIGDAGGQPQTYIVKKGDSLLRIAGCFKTSVDTIMDLNPKIKDPNLIILNQKILLPGSLVNRCKLPEDVCLNIPGHQASVPVRMIIDSQGNCVPDPGGADACPNIAGVQPAIPNNMIRDAAGSCVLPPPPVQRLPAPAPAPPPLPGPVVDVCPNLPGAQRTVPSGMIKDPTGSCVAIYVPCETVFRRDFAGGQRKVLLSSGSASNLFSKYLRAAEARHADVNLEALVVVMYVRSGDRMELISVSAPKLSVWQNATGKHEREWLRLLQDKRAERLPAPLEVGEQLRADVVCGE